MRDALCITHGSGLYLLDREKIERLFRRKKRKELNEKLKEEIEATLQNPALTAQEKENVKRKLTEIDMGKIETLAAKIKTMNAGINGE